MNLRGYDAGPAPSTDGVLDGLLRALNVPPGHIPADLEAKAALYRSLLAERRVLIILDNAANAEQVRTLLPGSDGCATIITSRSRLAGLTARDGAARMDLAVLPEDEALELLRAVAGVERIDEASAAAAELAALCGHLPLALRIAAWRTVCPYFAIRSRMGVDDMRTHIRRRWRLAAVTIGRRGGPLSYRS